MRVIEPITVDESVQISTTAASDDTEEYDEGTTYGEGKVVRVDKRRYESLLDDNDTYPPDHTPAEVGVEKAQWLDLGATNPWRPYDEVLAVQCEAEEDDLVIEIEPPSAITAIAFFRLSGVEVAVEIQEKDEGGEWETTWEREESLVDNADVYDAWTYAYLPIEHRADIAFFDLPTVIVDSRIKITIVGTDGPAKVGQIVMGKQIEIGATAYGSEASIEDFSQVERDRYGNATLRRRRYAEMFRYDVQVTAGDEHRVQRRLAAYRAQPTVYIGDPDRPETVIFGYYRDFNITLSNPALSRADIEVEGLT